MHGEVTSVTKHPMRVAVLYAPCVSAPNSWVPCLDGWMGLHHGRHSCVSRNDYRARRAKRKEVASWLVQYHGLACESRLMASFWMATFLDSMFSLSPVLPSSGFALWADGGHDL